MIKVSIEKNGMGFFAVRRPPDGGLLRLFGCFDVGAGLAPSVAWPLMRHAPSASPKRRFPKAKRPLPRHLRIGLMAD